MTLYQPTTLILTLLLFCTLTSSASVTQCNTVEQPAFHEA
jgi:hypothetical protein